MFGLISRDTHVIIYISVARADSLPSHTEYLAVGPLGALFIFMCDHDSAIVLL